jgi:chondroitin AC lyase
MILFLMVAEAPCSENDLSVIKTRIITPMISAGRTGDIQQLIESQTKDGSWPDVNYADENGGNWATSKHVSHLFSLVQGYRSKNSTCYGDDKCRNAISLGLDFWFKNDFINSNWWWNQIGIPGRMARTLLLFDDNLTAEQHAKGIDILKRSKIRMTGANLVDVAFITVMRGVLENDTETVKNAVDSIAGEIRITTGEGIQADFSFHQHGALLYNHGYGAVFSSKCGELAELVAGTSFAFPPEKIALMSGLILDGTRWMVRKSTRDYGATGRGLTRRAGESGSAAYIGGILDTMLKIPTGRESEFIALKDQIDGARKSSVIGNRYFWRGEIMTHHRDTFYISARMYSERLFNTDGSHNGEGLLSHYLCDGCTYIMQSGKEYHNIFPVWDWRKIPGTTVEIQAAFPEKIKIRGTGTFAGGVSDGMYGVASFDSQREGLAARKSWFFFDDVVVCLGNGISSGTGNPVLTTLNQCFLNGDVTVAAKGSIRTVKEGDHTLDSADWIHHDRIAYLLYDSPAVRLSNRAETGSWNSISRQASENTIEHTVFTLWLEHGNAPKNETYAYGIIPDISKEKAASYYANPSVSVLKNSPDIQIVAEPELGITGIAFLNAGSAELPDGTTVTVDSPCLALVTEKAHGYDISIADPENRRTTVTVRLKVKTAPERELFFKLPGGIYAGKTLTQRVAVK